MTCYLHCTVFLFRIQEMLISIHYTFTVLYILPEKSSELTKRVGTSLMPETSRGRLKDEFFSATVATIDNICKHVVGYCKLSHEE